MNANPINALETALKICRNPNREAPGASVNEIKAMAEAVCALWQIVSDTSDYLNEKRRGIPDEPQAAEQYKTDLHLQEQALADNINALAAPDSAEETDDAK